MKHLRWYNHLSINLFWLAINIRNNAVGALFLPYLVDMFASQESKNFALGGLRTAGLIIAMLAQPALGLLSDRSTSRFGRRRPFFVVGIVFDLLFLAALYFIADFPSLVVLYMVIQIAANTSHGPLQALIPDLVPEDQRGFSSGFKAIFELIPLIIVGFGVARLVGMGRLDWAIIVTGAAMVFILIPTLIFVKEQPLTEKTNVPFWPPMRRVLGMLAGILSGGVAGLVIGGAIGGLAYLVGWLLGGTKAGIISGVSLGGLVVMIVSVLVGVWSGVRSTIGREASHRKSSFLWWVINRLMFLAAVTSLQGFAPYFLMFSLNIEREAAVSLTGNLMTMVGLFTMLTAIPGGWISDRFGHRRVISISGVAAAAGAFLLLQTVFVPNLAIINVAGAILGLATGLFVTANWALGTALVPPKEAGRFLGVSNLAGAGAGMIGSGIGGLIADTLNRQSPGLGYFVLFAIFGVLFLLSSVTLLGVRSTAPLTAPQPAD